MRLLRRYRAPIQIAFGAVAVGFLVWVVVANWAAFVDVLQSMKPWAVALAVVAAFAGTFVNMLSWRSILLSFGHHLTVGQAGRVSFMAQIGKYIPGGVWPMAAGSQLGAQVGLAGTTTVVTMTLQLAISLVTGAVVAIGTLLLIPALAERYLWAVLLVLAAGLVALLPPVMSRLLRILFRLIRRPDLLPALKGKHLGHAIAWSLVGWLLQGLQLWFLFGAVAAWRWDTLLPAVSGYALSWLAGFLAVFAPAGAGVREGVLVLLFAGTFGTATIFGIALVSRIIFVFVDAAFFAAALASAQRASRRAVVDRT